MMAETEEKTDEQLTAEENIEKQKRDALEKAKTDPNASLDPAKIIPEVFKLLAIKPPNFEELGLEVVKLLHGEKKVEKAKEEDTLDKLIADTMLGIMIPVMMGVSLASGGLVALPSIPVIKKVMEILQDFDNAKKGQDTSSNRSTSVL